MRRISSVVFYVCLFLESAYAELPITRNVVSEVAKAHGFFVGQALTMDLIKRQHPSLARDANLLELEFKLVYGDAESAAAQYLGSLYKDKWDATKDRIYTETASNLPSTLSRQDALVFLELVQARIEGQIPSPIYEALLYLQPRYQSQPESEIGDGHWTEYFSKGAQKAQGLNIRIKLPASWEHQPGVRPHVVQKFQSVNGHGDHQLIVLIHDLGLGPIEFTLDDFPSTVAETAALDYLPDGATFIEGGRIVLDRIPGMWFVFDQTLPQGRHNLSLRSLAYHLYYRGKLIQLMFMIPTAMDGVETQSDGLEVMTPLFETIANSFTLLNQY